MACRALVAALFCASGVAAWAEPPRASPLPQPRPQASAAHADAASLVPHPAPRAIAAAAIETALAEAVLAAAPARSPRPAPRPQRAAAVAPERLATPAVTVATASAPRRGLAALFAPRPPKPTSGSVCGDPAISGAELAPIPAAMRGCGLTGGVAVSAVAGVRLSEPAHIDCTTAAALKTWVEASVIPAIGRRGGGLAALTVVASYDCRPRNGVPGARVSEHGLGHAVDVAAFVLADGSTLSVARDWRRQPTLLQALHASACGPFGTVLGPKSDASHQDHFHLDTARYRGGPYCR